MTDQMTLKLPDGRVVEVVDTKDALDQQVSDFLAAVETVREAGVEDVPDAETAERWFRSLITSNGGRLRFLRAPRKDAADDERAVFYMKQWHTSGGGLWSPMEWRWRVGETVFEQVTTFVAILRAYGRQGSSPALDAWKRTGLVG